MNLHAKCLMQLNGNSSHKPETNLSGFFFYFNILLHGIQNGFDLSFRKKDFFFLISSCKIFEGCLKL